VYTFTNVTGNVLNVSNANSNGGSVDSNVGGIYCGSTCGAGFTSGTTATLTAIPAKGYEFVGWGGACNGYAISCTVTMNATLAVTADFAALKRRKPVWLLLQELNLLNGG